MPDGAAGVKTGSTNPDSLSGAKVQGSVLCVLTVRTCCYSLRAGGGRGGLGEGGCAGPVANQKDSH